MAAQAKKVVKRRRELKKIDKGGDFAYQLTVICALTNKYYPCSTKYFNTYTEAEVYAKENDLVIE